MRNGTSNGTYFTPITDIDSIHDTMVSSMHNDKYTLQTIYTNIGVNGTYNGTNGTKNIHEKNAMYVCEKCHFKCSKHSDYDRHLLTRKHQMVHNGTKKTPKNAVKVVASYRCHCGKVYKYSQGLSRHKRMCEKNADDIEKNADTVTHMNDMLDRRETDLTVPETDLALRQKIILEREVALKEKEIALKEKEIKLKEEKMDNVNARVIHNEDILLCDKKKPDMDMITNIVSETVKAVVGPVMEAVTSGINGNNNHSHNHTNSHNKTFNMNVFLNENCKNAMNISEFVENLKIDATDFEKMGQIGHAESIARLMIRGLQDLDITKRPIHCSDLKREVIHIKDQDKWERDTPSQDKLRKAINHISNRNLWVMEDWKRENPGCTSAQHRKNDLYLKLLTESLGPLDEEKQVRELKKIGKKIAMNTILDKTTAMDAGNK